MQLKGCSAVIFGRFHHLDSIKINPLEKNEPIHLFKKDACLQRYCQTESLHGLFKSKPQSPFLPECWLLS